MKPSHPRDGEELRRLVEPDDSRAHAELLRIAFSLQATGRRVLGLWPADPDVPVLPLALRLAVALHEISDGEVGVVDANLRWPGTTISEGEATATDLLFVRESLRPGVSLIGPRRQGPAGAGVPQLRLLVRATDPLFSHLLVDLTGYSEIGDHVEALEITEGVVLVARAGKTTEGDLLRRVSELHEGKNLGVVLLG